jgi:DNA end-binding protein Ku
LPKTKAKRSRSKRNSNQDEQEASARPFWSGTISFGLVSIPVDLYPATRDSRVALRMLSPEGEPLSREYYSAESGKELDASDMTRGFETDQGKYVTVSAEELERLAPEKSRDIDLRLFVPREAVSPLFFEKPYFLTPADNSVKAYRLLAETMDRSGQAGIATFVMRGKEYLVAIFSEGGILRAQTLRFHDEVRKPKDISLPKKPKSIPSTTLRSFETTIARATKKTLDLKAMRDEYASAMLDLIEKKHARQKDVVETEAPTKGPAKVIDLMEVLKQSLGQGRKPTRAA